jgi:hypothetical protein
MRVPGKLVELMEVDEIGERDSGGKGSYYSTGPIRGRIQTRLEESASPEAALAGRFPGVPKATVEKALARARRVVDSEAEATEFAAELLRNQRETMPAKADRINEALGEFESAKYPDYLRLFKSSDLKSIAEYGVTPQERTRVLDAGKRILGHLEMVLSDRGLGVPPWGRGRYNKSSPIPIITTRCPS